MPTPTPPPTRTAGDPCRCGCSKAIHVGPDGECETCGCEQFGEYDGPRESRTDGRTLSEELHEAAKIQRWRDA